MKKALLLLLVVGGGLAVFIGGPSGILLGVLTIAAAALLFSLRKFFPQTQAASAVGNLVAPSVGTAFAEHASTTGEGEVLLPYETYKILRKRLLGSATTGLILLLLTLVGLRTLPVPAFILFVPVLIVCVLLLLFSAFSLLKLVPSGQRLHTLKTLFLADPRLVFAQHASHLSNGEVTVGYTTFKKTTRATTYVLGALLLAVLLVLTLEVQQAKNLSQENLDAASKQLQVLTDHLINGQGDLKEQFGKLIAQSLEPAPTVNEDSITSKLLASITSQLPAAPEQIVTNNVTEETQVINRDFIEAHTTEAIKLGTGSILSYQDSSGTVFLRLGTGPTVTIPDLATLNVEGFFKLDGTEVTATADDLNRTSNLDNTDQGDEGARYVGTRAAGFTNFSPSRDDVQAALAAIDTSLGAVGGGTSGFTPGSVIFANTDGTLTQDNPNFFWDNTNNRLGIGTTTPLYTLDILKSQNAISYANITNADGGASAYATFQATSDSASALFGIGAAAAGEPALADAGYVISNANASGGLAISTRANASIRFYTNSFETNERMRIDGGGNVGIGNTAPSYALDVTGTLRTTTGALFQGAVGIGITPTSLSNSLLVVRGATAGATAGAAEFFGAGGGTIMYARNDGTVGIGTNSTTDLGSSGGSVAKLIVSGVTQGSGAAAIKAINSNSTTSGVIGILASNLSTGSSTQGYSYGFATTITSSNTGGITDVRHFNANTPLVSGGGTVTTSTGLYINSQKTSGVTTGYGIYQAGSTDLNYFAGNVGIGTTAPTTGLAFGNGAAQKFWIENSATDVVGRALTVAAGSTVAGTGSSNVTGGNLILQAGLGTGTGASTISFQTGTTLTTGMTLQTMSTKMTILGSGNVGIGNTAPSFTFDVTGSSRIAGQTTSTDGFVEKVVAGPCSDSNFTTDTDGLMCIDSSNGRIYFRYSGAWHYTAQTAGFQIPTILNPYTNKLETDGLKPGDLVMGQLNERLDDGALHGVYVKFDLDAEILKLTTVNIKNLIASGTLVVHGDTTLLGDLDIKGVLTLDKQQGGFATIPEGGTEVEITFDKAFIDEPVVVVTPDRNISVAVRNRSKTGFTIRLAAPADAGVVFSWLAMPIKGAKTTNGQVAGESDVTATPSPSPSISPQPSPSQGGESPAVTPEPSASPTPSVSATPTATPTPTPDGEPE